MAAQVFEEDEGVIAEINIVPFVDIVLVLLIIFMLTSSLIAKANISVELPNAAAAGDPVPSTLNIVLNKDHELYLNGKRIDHTALGGEVARAAWKKDDLQAAISADKRVDYGDVIRIIDVVKSSGVKSFALNIEREF